MAEGSSEYECPCTNIAIMQLFHELKQKFPYVPDRVVNECIRKNGYDKGACEWALEKENRAYLLHSYPPGLGSRMSSDEDFGPVNDCEGCCPRTNHFYSYLPAGGDQISHQPRAEISDFDRRLPGRQSLDSLCRRQRTRKSVTFKHYSDEYLHQPTTTENVSRPVEDASASRLPFMTCNFNNDDLNLTVSNGRVPADIGGGTGHHCQKASFIRSESISNSNSLPRDWDRPVNRPSSLVNKTGLGGTGGGSDLRLEFASDVKSCHCERTSVSVVSSCSVDRGLPKGPHSAPVTPSGYPPPLFPPLSLDVTTPRHRTALSLEPSPPYMAEVETPSQRPFTRVNLTLRPPSADPQPPIDIRSSAGGGLTYTTCSYDPRQGFQSSVRISIGPGGQGSVSAARSKTNTVAVDRSPLPLAPAVVPASSSAAVPLVTDAVGDEASSSTLFEAPEPLDPDTQAVVNEQLNRKQRLEKELAKEKETLRTMQQEVAAMERDLNSRRSKINKCSKVQMLKDEIRRLSSECKYMTAEVDLSLPIQVPLGETSEDFYRNIYRGQEGHLLESRFPRDSSDHRQRAVAAGPSSLNQYQQIPASGATGAVVTSAPATLTGNDGPNWTCNLCTFRNHPLLVTCEQCEMPRGVFGTTSTSTSTNASSSTSYNITSPDSGSETSTEVDNCPPSQLGSSSRSKAPNFVH